MKHVMKHDLSDELAKKVAQKAFDSYKASYANYNPTLTWRNDHHADASFSAKGMTLKGQIELAPGAISFDLEVPFMLRMFKGKAVEIMDRELRSWTEKAKRGELD